MLDVSDSYTDLLIPISTFKTLVKDNAPMQNSLFMNI